MHECFLFFSLILFLLFTTIGKTLLLPAIGTPGQRMGLPQCPQDGLHRPSLWISYRTAPLRAAQGANVGQVLQLHTVEKYG